MILVTITCDTKRTWSTLFNGDHKAASNYFLGRVFTEEDHSTGRETTHRVVCVESKPNA